MNSKTVYQTPGTRHKWSSFAEWMHVAQFHFESMPDGSHRRHPNREGAQRHMAALLNTDLIEQCDDRSSLEQAHEFFNRIQCNNSSFCKSENPPDLRNRIHNQLQRLQSRKPLPQTVTQLERDIAKQTFTRNARIEGFNDEGIWKAGTILYSDRQREFCVVRFDDDTFTQKPLVRLLQQGFVLSHDPGKRLERIEFRSGDRVRVKWWKENAKPATVLGVDGDRVTVADHWGRATTHDAIELVYHFDSSHPDPETFLRQLEAKIQHSLVEGATASPIERDDLERQQERWIAQAEAFAQAHSISIDGSGNQWILTATRSTNTDNSNSKSMERTGQEPVPTQSPPDNLETNDLEQNLLEALSLKHYEKFWQNAQQKGISDSDLKQAIGHAFGEFRGTCGQGQAWTVAGKKNPKFWNRIAAPCTPNPDLQGKALVQKVRSLLELPYPSQPATKTAHSGTVVNVRHNAYTTYIGRANKSKKLQRSKWHNPYVVGKDGSLNEVLQKFLNYLLGRDDLMASLEELDGEVLGCWCADADIPFTINDSLRCHGQILLRARRGDYKHLSKFQLKFEQLVLPLF